MFLSAKDWLFVLDGISILLGVASAFYAIRSNTMTLVETDRKRFGRWSLSLVGIITLLQATSFFLKDYLGIS